MSHESYQALHAELTQHVEAHPLQGGFRGAGSLAGRIMEWVWAKAKESFTVERKRQIRDAAVKFYDEFNLPQVPDFIELPVKAYLREGFVLSLNSLLQLPPTG